MPSESIQWTESGQQKVARWHSERGVKAPKQVIAVDDTLTADQACRLASEGTGLLWTGDFHNARQLLSAMARRLDRKTKGSKSRDKAKVGSLTDAFHRYRQLQAQKASILNKLLLPVCADKTVPLRRAPDVSGALVQIWHELHDLAQDPGGKTTEPAFVMSFRELQGLIGAYEWSRKGLEVNVLGAPPANRIYPAYGVFSPVRGEYLQLVAHAPIPEACQVAMDVGTGTGVLAALLVRRGVARVVATDVDERALACARRNLEELVGVAERVEVLKADLFAPGQVDLLVCNPPWLPGKAASAIERAIYDENSAMLSGFLKGAALHLKPQGEAWLVLSDLAEHLGLRSRDWLENLIQESRLVLIEKIDIRPMHGKAQDEDDPLFEARSKEITSLWRLGLSKT